MNISRFTQNRQVINVIYVFRRIHQTMIIVSDSCKIDFFRVFFSWSFTIWEKAFQEKHAQCILLHSQVLASYPCNRHRPVDLVLKLPWSIVVDVNLSGLSVSFNGNFKQILCDCKWERNKMMQNLCKKTTQFKLNTLYQTEDELKTFINH